MLFDTHAHLLFDEKKDDPAGDIARAREAGVALITTIGTDASNNRPSVDIAAANDGVYAAVGIHPHEADKYSDSDLAELAELAAHPKVVAIGETGLDYYRDYADHANQRALFERQIALAVEKDMPLILHIREAHADGLAVLCERFPEGWKGIAHCFGGDAEVAKAYLELGFLISIPGTVTYPKAEKTREVARSVPLESLVVETDCPFLSPQPVRSKRNEPAYLRHTAEFVAELRGMPFEEFARATTGNALRIFNVEDKQ